MCFVSLGVINVEHIQDYFDTLEAMFPLGAVVGTDLVHLGLCCKLCLEGREELDATLTQT